MNAPATTQGSPAPLVRDAEAIAHVRGRDLPFAKVGTHDVDGVMHGKYMARDKFESVLKKGFGFCDVVLGRDSNDQLYDSTTLTGRHTAYPDAPVRIVPETMRLASFESDLPFFLGLYEAALSGRVRRLNRRPPAWHLRASPRGPDRGNPRSSHSRRPRGA